MGNIKEINIKNRTYYFFDDMINIKDFDPNLLKIDKKSHKNIDIYYIGYITVKDSYYVKINSVNSLYLIISEGDGFIKNQKTKKNKKQKKTKNKKKNGRKYLVSDLLNENNEVLKKYNEFLDGIKNEIETINGGKTSKQSSTEYDKDFMKIKFSSDDNLPLNKTLKFHNITIVIRSLFEEHGIFYPQVYLDECLYKLV